MDLTWRKIAIVCAGFMSIFLIPLGLCSEMMLDFYFERAAVEANSEFTKTVLRKASWMAFRTLRYEKAAEGYRRYLEMYPEDEDRPQLLLQYGLALEESARFKYAVEIYEEIIDSYPDTPEREESKVAIDRIRYVRRR